jgi:hypothetical protein
MTAPVIPTQLLEAFLENPSPDALGNMFGDELEDRLPEGASTSGASSDPGQAAAAQNPGAPIPGGGHLLEEQSDAKVFKEIDREVLRQEPLAKNRDQEGLHWDRVKRNIPFSYLEKSEDQAVWEAKLPPGVEDRPQPIPNKVLDLATKQVSQILVDPPLPNPKADGDSERTRGAMDLAGRFLRGDGDSSGTNDSELWREALTLNRTRKSAFVYVWVDPTAGGWRPKQKKAHPRATDPSNPLMGPQLDDKGQPVMDANGQPKMERAVDPTLRFVAEVDDPEHEGGTIEVFTQNAAEAAREWLPKHRRRVVSPNMVRTFPQSANVFNAHSITMLMWDTLGEARRRFPQLAKMTKSQLKQLTTWKPKRWKAIVPEAQRPRGEGLDASGDVTDDTLLFWYHKFCRISLDYPDGAEIAVSGASFGAKPKGVVLLRDTLREDVELEDGTTVPVLMDPPISQFRSIIDVDTGDPFGGTPVSAYGGANEIRAHLYLSTLDDIDVRLRPNVYLAGESEVTKDDMNRRDGTPIDVLSKDHMPVFETRPAMPANLPTMLENIEHDMDTAANLNQTAQALDSQYSESGEAKKVAISQAKVQLAQEWQGFVNGVVHYWKIKLQLAQARLKTPQLVNAAGENSAYKSRHFVGADMFGVSTAPLLPGTATMMSPAEKAQYLAQGQNLGWLDKEAAGERFRSSMSDDLGLPPSPYEEHIDRCIAVFMDGPTKEWLAQYKATQEFPQQMQQYNERLAQAAQLLTARGIDPQTAQMQATQSVGPAPVQPGPLSTPFEPRANDEEPVVAKTYYTKLSRFMVTTDFSDQPVEWQKTLEEKYEQSAYAAGIQTVRQQQAAQQQQQAAEAEKNKPAKDPNAPPMYEEFIAAATKAVIAKTQSLLAREVAALGEATSIEQKPSAEHVPAELEQPTSPEPTHPVDLAHQSMEAERGRGHELEVQARNHANTMEQIDAKSAAAVGTALAKADRQAAHEAGKPRPPKSTS